MNWARFALASLAAGTVVSLTDWFFFGVLFHDKYLAYPEVWRASPEGTRRAVWILLGFFTCAIFTYACVRLNATGYSASSKLALWMSLAVALPIIVTDALFMKLHPLVVVAHSLGWITRLGVAAISAGLFLPKS